ncbi:MAG: hypothetical protein ACYC65_15345, partial [Candidatus Limnocylindrales bacterium]
VGRDASREPQLTAAAQTRLSWARRITAVDELPVPFDAAVRVILGNADLPYAVLTPAFLGHQRRCSEHLVFSRDDRIHVLERTAAGIATTTYPIAGLHAVEFGEVLLDGWITLRGATAGGSVASSTLRFNSVTSDLLAPFEFLVRPRPDPADLADPAEQAARLAWLRPRDFKFHELARSVVWPGDRVVDLVFQPLITAPVAGLPGGMFRRTIALAHLLLLTTTELILIADSSHAPEARGHKRHGAVRTHVSLDRVVSARLSARPDGGLAIVLELPAGHRLEAVFDPDARGDVDRFLGNLVATAPRAGHA